MSRERPEDLSTEEVYELIDQAYDFGMRGYYLFGGEPLIRRDIEDVVEYAKKKGFLTTMNTNGSLLKEKAESLGKNLDFAFVSLDYFNDYDDFIRGRKGHFEEVVEGIRKIREGGRTRVTLVTTISNLNRDAIKPMAEFAQKLGVGISFNSVEFQSFFKEGKTTSPVEDYGLNRDQLKTFYSMLLKLKNDGYPLMETNYVLKHYVENKPFTCHFPKMFVYVSPDKKIFSCDPCNPHTYNLKKGSFKDYFNSLLYKDYVKTAEKCNICVRTCVRMYSYAYAPKLMDYLDLYGDVKIFMNQKRSQSAEESIAGPSL
jgi:MoaA/NifB/PqqE/SkfB family radical SAM enzyme